jgi:rubredoxin-NAD+ reductase
MEPIAAPIVVIGAGLAGYTVIRELRKLDTSVPITLITSDAGDFYAKPALSNALAQGKSAAQLVTTCAEAMAAQLGITLLNHTQVHGINTATHTIATTRGELRYAKLVLALGADPIRLPLEGDAAEAVMSVNDLSDYAAFRDRLEHARHVAILGAGLIGCEFANDLASAGYRVTVIAPSSRPLANLLPEAAGRAVSQGLEKAGVYWIFGRRAAAVSQRARGGVELTLDDGNTLEADLVLSAVGLRPRTALARAAGIAVNRGITVNARLESSAPDVYAIGDCAEIDGQVLPYVQPIMQAAKSLAKTLAGEDTAVTFLPMPVIVKTPACPVATQPVPQETTGAWQCAQTADGLRMVCMGPDSRLIGFALTGKCTAERAALTKQLTGRLA